MKKFRFHVDIWRSLENAAAPREQRISLIPYGTWQREPS